MGGKIAFAEKPVAQAKNQTFIGTFIETDLAAKKPTEKAASSVCAACRFSMIAYFVSPSAGVASAGVASMAGVVTSGSVASAGVASAGVASVTSFAV